MGGGGGLQLMTRAEAADFRLCGIQSVVWGLWYPVLYSKYQLPVEVSPL